MVDYIGAIKKPFQDLQTLVIGIIIGFIPFVSLLVTGYSAGMARKVMKGDNKMPKWDPNEIVQYIKDIVFIIVIWVVYMVPAGILFLIGGAAFAGSILSALSGGGSDVFGAAVGGLATGGVLILLGGLLAIIGALFALMGVMSYLKNGSFGSAFMFGAILRKILTGTFWATVIVMIIYSVVLVIVAGVLSIIPIIGTLAGFGLMVFLSATTGYTMLAQTYKETP